MSDYTSGFNSYDRTQSLPPLGNKSSEWWRGYYDAMQESERRHAPGRPLAKTQGPAPFPEAGSVIPDGLGNRTFTPNAEPRTYIGGGGLIKLEVHPGARFEQLKLARRFLDLLIDLEAKL